ncbi:Homeobox-leucine zipper protein ROC5 [Zea mays]|uniref:Homeobox-leucine zipper protein ROC5 n=1 Tax=Zea mays TaxID=4577 RepID=A0A3L6G844_MAIZE|nr:Homeobox-leucine zipper protein ROC5 [Zea mays]
MANAACVGGSFLGVEKGKPATVSNLGAPAVLLLVLACLPLVLPSSDPKQGMSFGDLDGGGSAAGLQYPYGAFASSPVLSLTVVDARRRRGGGGNAKDASEAENEGQSMMSGHLDVVLSGGGDGEDGEAANQRKPKRKKPYNRHTPRQIEQLEAMFKEFHHPDEKQRAQLSRQLGLDPRQVKFWFQNRRTHLKNQLERQENARLKHENDKLRVENLSIREAIRDLVCSCCGGPAVLGELSPEEHQLRLENARLRDELARMQAELQMLSPLVPIREVTFLRFCKQLAEGAWAVVDVSIDGLQTDQCLATNTKCRRLPSGCVLQDTPNGCKVTWVEHAEYPEASVHQLYQPLMRSGLALGAGRWLATLQRQCECLAILMSSLAAPEHDSAAVSLEGKWSLLKLARRMMENFCAGMGASSSREWSMLDGFTGSTGKDVRVMVQNSVDEPGVPPGVVLSVATAVWLPVTPERLFNFLRDEELRAEWDILSNGGPMQQVLRITKGQLDGNSVALLRADHTDSHLNSILILQETCSDRSGAMVVYAPVDFPAMQLVLGGGDSKNVALLPSGFVILPAGSSAGGVGHKSPGSLLTVAFQILVNSQPTAKLTVESVDTVYSLISCTIEKIKAALHCDVC